MDFFPYKEFGFFPEKKRKPSKRSKQEVTRSCCILKTFLAAEGSADLRGRSGDRKTGHKAPVVPARDDSGLAQAGGRFAKPSVLLVNR